MNDSLITCIVCNGSKINPFNSLNQTCKCCEGIGKITQQKYDFIQKVRNDLALALKTKISKYNKI
jgi:DnaJ-class molecular chaperone